MKLYTGESDSEDGYEEAVENAPTCGDPGNLFGDAVITIQAEISVLDSVDFDEPIDVAESINPFLAAGLKGTFSAPILRKKTLFSKPEGAEKVHFIHLWFNRRFFEGTGILGKVPFRHLF